MRFRDMPYRRVTYEEIEAEYRALFRDVQAVACEDDCLWVLQRQYRLGDAMTPIDLCYVRHGMDVNDPFYAREQAYYDDIGPKISALRNRFGELLVKSPFADCFERLMGSFAFTLIRTGLMGDDSSLIPLQQEENALLSRYNQLVSNAKADYGGVRVSRSSLARDQQSPDRAVRRRAYQAAVDSWEEQRAELEDIYDSLVKNRDRQAKALGFASFVELSYLRMNRIGYTPEDVRRFREQANTIKNTRGRSLGCPACRNIVAFHQRCGERKSNFFLRRHVRLRKYRSACKRASWPPEADSACAAVRPQLPCQKGILFDRLKAPEAFASGAPLVYRLHGPLGGHVQCVGDHINDRLRLSFVALFENSGSDAKTNMNKIHNYFTPFVRFPTPSHTMDDIGWLVLPVTSVL